MVQLSRENHYIPQMYLSNWASDNKIWVYYLLVSHENVPLWSRKSVDRIAFHTNLYMRVDHGEESDDFERNFSLRFESPAKIPLTKIISDQKLCADEWQQISQYIAAQYVRTPSFYQFIHDKAPAIAKTVFENTAKELPSIKHEVPKSSSNASEAALLPIDVEFLDEIGDDKQIGLELKTVVGKSYWLFAIKHFLEPKSSILQAFCNLKWSIVTAPKGCSFLTTDNPVAVFCENKTGAYEITTGITAGENMVLFPVSPQKALIGKNKNRLDYRIDASVEMFHKLQKVIIDNAFLLVFSDHEDPDTAQIRNRIVDEASYKRLNADYKNWYDSYKEQEVPMLHKWEDNT